MAEDKELRRYLQIGTIAMVAGVLIAVAGSLFAHFTGLPALDNLNREIYPSIPRGWQYVLAGQIVGLTGGLVFMGGVALAFLYRRQMTWARAAIGAALFTSLMMILFGIVPNEWLTLTQSEWEWTPQEIAFTIPPVLVLNNDISISYAAVADIVSASYVTVLLVVVAVAMYHWQERSKRAAGAPPVQKVSEYGRPLTKVEG